MTESLLFTGFDLPDDYTEARRCDLGIAVILRRGAEASLQQALAEWRATTGEMRMVWRSAVRRCIGAYRRAMHKRDMAWAALYPVRSDGRRRIVASEDGPYLPGAGACGILLVLYPPRAAASGPLSPRAAASGPLSPRAAASGPLSPQLPPMVGGGMNGFVLENN